MENGLTLVESLVTIAVMAVGVVGIGAALAETEHIAAINQDQSQFEVAMRQLSDFVRDSSSSGLTYKTCEQSTANDTSAYNKQLPARPPGLFWTIAHVDESSAGTRNGAPTPPLSTKGCAPGTGDWGVQEITVTVSDGARSLTRTVWKSASW